MYFAVVIVLVVLNLLLHRQLGSRPLLRAWETELCQVDCGCPRASQGVCL